MLNKPLASLTLLLALGLSLAVEGQAPRSAGPAPGDWPEMRGPARDGKSPETGLLSSWRLNGENFLWRAPYGGRSAPERGRRVATIACCARRISVVTKRLLNAG